jgi:MFS family permease
MNSPPPTVPATPAPYDGVHGAACALVSVLLGLTRSLTVFGVNNNPPTLQGALGATAVEVSWLSTAYFAAALSAVVLMTKLRPQVGIERFATWSTAGFVAVSLGYSLAPSLATAIAARAFLGLTAAPLITLAVLYMMEAKPPARVPVGAVLGFGTVQLGSPLGRIIAQALFDAAPGAGLPMFDAALALVSVVAISAVPMRPTVRQQVFNAGDLLAFGLYATGLARVCVVVTQGRARWWTDTPWLGTCLCLGIALLGAYVILESTHPDLA